MDYIFYIGAFIGTTTCGFITYKVIKHLKISSPSVFTYENCQSFMTSPSGYTYKQFKSGILQKKILAFFHDEIVLSNTNFKLMVLEAHLFRCPSSTVIAEVRYHVNLTHNVLKTLQVDKLTPNYQTEYNNIMFCLHNLAVKIKQAPRSHFCNTCCENHPHVSSKILTDMAEHIPTFIEIVQHL